MAQYHDDNCEIAHFQDGSALNEITFLLGDEKNVKLCVIFPSTFMALPYSDDLHKIFI